jgi:hypothetical protein
MTWADAKVLWETIRTVSKIDAVPVANIYYLGVNILRSFSGQRSTPNLEKNPLPSWI